MLSIHNLGRKWPLIYQTNQYKLPIAHVIESSLSLCNILHVVEFILIDFSLIVKQAVFAYVNYTRLRSWNQPVLNSEGKVSY